MDAKTLEKLKKEAADALSSALVNSTQWENVPALVKALEALDGMKAEPPSSGCEVPGCVLPRGHIDMEPLVAGGHLVPSEAPLGERLAGGVGVVTPPRPASPCPVPGCTYAAGHNAAHTYAKTQAVGFPCANITCRFKGLSSADGRVCDGCRDEADRVAMMQHHPPEEKKAPARAHIKGCTLDTMHEGFCYGPSLLSEDVLRHGIAAKANIPSGKAMLLDGPAPTAKQVAHIRAAVLEEAVALAESFRKDAEILVKRNAGISSQAWAETRADTARGIRDELALLKTKEPK